MNDVATSFNPLAITRSLEAAGIDRKQAEAIAEATRQAAVADHGQLATKVDLQTEIQLVRTELRWLMTIVGFQFAITLAIAARAFGVL